MAMEKTGSNRARVQFLSLLCFDFIHTCTTFVPFVFMYGLFVFIVCRHIAFYQARREPQRGPGNHYRAALSLLHSICDEIETLKKGRKRGEGRDVH